MCYSVDNFGICGKITEILQRQCGKEAVYGHTSERGLVTALCLGAAGHFQAVRDDRNGCSRYRAAKMSPGETN